MERLLDSNILICAAHATLLCQITSKSGGHPEAVAVKMTDFARLCRRCPATNCNDTRGADIGDDVPPREALEGCRPRRPFHDVTTLFRRINIQKFPS